MRKMSSLVWKDMRKIQKIGNRKKRTMRAIRTPRTTRSRRDICSKAAFSLSHPAGAFAQFQPLFDEDVRKRIGYGPQDDQKRGGLADVRILVELEIGADLEDEQGIARSALGHRIDDVELLDRIKHAEQRGGDDVGRQHRQRDPKEDEPSWNAIERRSFERLCRQGAQA